jgi:hypothetical protein
MGLSKAWWFTTSVSLLATVLLCVGAFHCLPSTELDVSTVLTLADSPPLHGGADEGFLAVPQEEAELAHKAPVNADLLTMLMLAVSSFFGASFGWVLTNSHRQGALCSSLGVTSPSLARACEELPFLGVFRL